MVRIDQIKALPTSAWHYSRNIYYRVGAKIGEFHRGGINIDIHGVQNVVRDFEARSRLGTWPSPVLNYLVHLAGVFGISSLFTRYSEKSKNFAMSNFQILDFVQRVYSRSCTNWAMTYTSH